MLKSKKKTTLTFELDENESSAPPGRGLRGGGVTGIGTGTGTRVQVGSIFGLLPELGCNVVSPRCCQIAVAAAAGGRDSCDQPTHHTHTHTRSTHS